MIIKRPLMYMAGGFVLGEVLTLLSASAFMGLLALLALGVLWWWIKGASSRKPAAVLMLLVCCVLGFWRMEVSGRPDSAAAYVAAAGGKTVEIRGEVDGIAEKEKSYALSLSSCRMVQRQEIYPMPNMLVYVDKKEFLELDRQTTVRIGMEISAVGKPEEPGEARNPGEFDFRSYYRAIGIRYQMFGKRLQVTDGRWRRYEDGLFRMRLWAAKVLERICEPEDLGIFQAAVLGDKHALDDGILELYQRNGIAHLLAISGLHISMVGLGVYRLLRKAGLGYGAAGVTGTFVIVGYGILTGLSPSVYRAVTMVLVYILAEYLGRCYDMLSAAALACLLLLVESPELLFQAGFQLSFGAVTAIGGVGPWLVERLCLIPPPDVTWREKLRCSFGNALVMGLSIQLVTYPVILYHFFQYPVYGILLNLVVIPLMAYVILSGISGIFLGAVWIEAGVAAIGAGHYILGLYQWLCGWCERIPFANLVIGRPKLWQIGVYYIMLMLLFWWLEMRGSMGEKREDAEKTSKGREEKESFGEQDCPGVAGRWIGFGVGCIISFFVLWHLPVSGMQVTFLDVGQGDGICIQTKEAVILVDGGSSSEKELGKYTMEPYLKSRGISRIDYAIVSHGDSDHISGLIYLLEKNGDIRIEHLILPWLGKGDEAYEPLVRLMEAHGGEIHWMRQGERIQRGKLTMTCLYHGDEKRKEDRNEQSIVLRADYGGTGILFTGDMSSVGEEGMMKSLAAVRGGSVNAGSPKSEAFLDGITVLKVAHHGSKYSTCEKLLQEMTPEWAVISYAEGNSYGHPHREVLERLEQQHVKTWETARKGAVILHTDGKNIQFSSVIP